MHLKENVKSYPNYRFIITGESHAPSPVCIIDAALRVRFRRLQLQRSGFNVNILRSENPTSISNDLSLGSGFVCSDSDDN